MHQNIIVAEIDINPSSGKINNIIKIENAAHMPVSASISTTDLGKWWNRRAVPITRKGIRPILDTIGLESVESLLVSNLGLSLTDQYWIKPMNKNIEWKDINLYENEFDDIIGTSQFSNSNDFSIQNQLIPGASTQGDLPKKWIRGKDDKIYLIKGNSGLGFQQSINEILASQIHQKQNLVSYVNYSLVETLTNNGLTVGCMCENFTNSNLEFVPAIDICLSDKKQNDMSEFDFFIEKCSQNGLSKSYVQEFLDYQIVTDFLITNTDRHFNNFGVLRDVSTLKYISMAPIFDSGNSMYWNQNILTDYSLLNVNTASFAKKEHQLLKYISNKKIIDIGKLPTPQEIKALYKLDENISEKRINKLADIFSSKCMMLEMYQKGLDLSKTAYEYRNKSFLCENTSSLFEKINTERVL